MKTKFKIFKIVSFSLLAFVLVLFVATSLVANYYMTPQKLTPIINNLSKNLLQTDLKIGSVDVNVTQNFPYVAVILKDGVLMSRESLDRTWGDTVINKKDILLDFSRIEISVNPWKYIFSKEINISLIDIKNPDIYMYVSPFGLESWDVSFQNASKVQSDEDEDIIEIRSVVLDKISISNANFTYDNRKTKFYTEADNYNFLLKGDFSKKASNLQLTSSINNLLLWYDNNLLVKDFSIKLETELLGDTITKSLRLDKTKLDLNGIEMTMSGYLGKDTLNVDTHLKSNNIDYFFKMIPPSIARQNKKFSSSGIVELNININKRKNLDDLPIIKGKAILKDIAAQYKGFPKAIDKLNLESNFYIDYNNKPKSYFKIDDLKFLSGNSVVDIKTKVTNLIDNPLVDLNGQISINLSEIRKIIPLHDSVTMSGQMDFNGKIKFYTNEIIKGNYAKTQADTKIGISKVKVNIPSEYVNLSVDSIWTEIKNNNKGLLSVDLFLDSLDLSYKNQIYAHINKTTSSMEGISNGDSTSYMIGNIQCGGINIKANSDTTEVFAKDFILNYKVLKDKYKANFDTQFLGLRYLTDTVKMSDALIEANYSNKNINGNVTFTNFVAKLSMLKKDIFMKNSKLELINSKVLLDKTLIKIGNSDFSLTGWASNIWNAYQQKGNLIINSSLQSDFLDIDELMALYVEDTTQIAQQSIDSTSKIFVVPSILELDFALNVKKAKMEELDMRNISGLMKIKNQQISINSMAMSAVGAEFNTALEYDCKDNQSARSRFVLEADEIDVNSVIQLLPTIDTLMPMIKSLSGLVTLDLSVDAKFDSKMNVILDSVEGAINLEGKNLKLLDGEEFTEIAKMLHFKKKKSNKIDHINAQVVIEDGRIEVFPFLLEINRYKLAVGGEHFLDNTFNYHISILKSPIPFKMGVNVTGSIDKMKYKFGKAKYKHAAEPTERGKINPSYLKKWNKLSQGLVWK